MSRHVFGIRHHGPGSARSLLRALVELRPDALLIEGPPDADALLPLAGHAAMEPPVALLVYRPDEPRRAVYYPFARFSPEWQAIRYGLAAGVPVRFMDLPQAHQLADDEAVAKEQPDRVRDDPLGRLAEAAGYGDVERWWEHAVEQRRDGAGLFDAVLEAMAAAREVTPVPEEPREARREAHMRRAIRTAEAAGFRRIAVVCGAWHAPALVRPDDLSGDDALLAGLPTAAVRATWIPWTHGRLTFASGYGAGVGSPGWYDHLWSTLEHVAVGWLTRVAQLLRGEDLDASAAHVIEAVRLAESLAALRGRPLPGLPEMNEACLAVLTGGEDAPMRLIEQKLIVGERLGAVPDEAPSVPLQEDLAREQRRLRLTPEAGERVLDLDLRQETDLARSHLLHRLALLGIEWGRAERVSGKSGTFHELWRLRWEPELAVAVIQAGIWGNTVAAAAAARARDAADGAADLPAITQLVDKVVLADLPEVVAHLMARLQAAAAVASDVGHLMDALPPLANVLRYGSVRRSDTSAVGRVVDGLVARACVGLPAACVSLDDEAAAQMHERIVRTDGALGLLRDEEHLGAWRRALRALADQRGLHGLIAGRACRLLLEAGALDADETRRRLGLALSRAAEPAHAAAWIEGFLSGSGLVLLHDRRLWDAIDEWVGQLPGDTFTAALPLLRRTFATFAAGERRQLGQRAASGPSPTAPTADATIDHARAAAVLPLVARILGLPTPEVERV